MSIINPRRSTRLYDAINFGYEKLSNTKFNKRALLIISDGQDTLSKKRFKDVRKLAENSNTLVYSIRISDATYIGSIKKAQAQIFLEELSVITGSKSFNPLVKEELYEVFQRIALELRSQNELSIELAKETYQKVQKSKETRIKLKVDLKNNKSNKGNKKFKLFARTREKIFLEK